MEKYVYLQVHMSRHLQLSGKTSSRWPKALKLYNWFEIESPVSLGNAHACHYKFEGYLCFMTGGFSCVTNQSDAIFQT